MAKFRLRKRALLSSNQQSSITDPPVQEQPQPQCSLSPTGPSATTGIPSFTPTYVSSSQSERSSVLTASLSTQTGAPFPIVSPCKNNRLSQRKVKRLRQNKHRVKKTLHTDPEVKSYALASLVAETLREGECCEYMTDALSGFSSIKEVLTAKNNRYHQQQMGKIQRITQHYVNMLMYRSAGRFSKAAQEAATLKKNFSCSKIGEVVGRSKSEVSRLLNCTYKPPSRGITQEQKQVVTDFVKNDSLVALAGRRYRNIRFMNRTFSKSYLSYRAHVILSGSSLKPVGLTTYYNLLRKAQTTDSGSRMRVRPRSKIPWIDAQCLKCVNLKLCTKSLLANGVPVSNRTTINLSATVCPFYIPRQVFEELLLQNGTKAAVETPVHDRPSGPTKRKPASGKTKGLKVSFADQKTETETEVLEIMDPALWVQINQATLQHVPDLDLTVLTRYAATKCLTRECKWCGVWMLDAILEKHKDRFQDLIGFESWATLNDENAKLVHPCRKITFEASLKYVINKFKDLLHFSSKHLLILKWQQEQFSIRLSNLLPGEVLTVMDYAMNIEVQEQENTSESHFNRHNFTVGVFVTFFVCREGCDQLRKHDFIMLTSRHSKDQHCTFMMTKKYLEEMEKSNMISGKVESLTEFCDNCAGQFKSKLSPVYMSQLGIPVTRMFFAARHGKGVADAAIATFKSILYDNCRAGNARLRTEHDVINFFQLHTSVKESSQRLSDVLFPNQKQKRSYCKHSDRSCIFVRSSLIKALEKKNPKDKMRPFNGVRSAHAFCYDPKNDEWEEGEDGKTQRFPVLEHRSLNCLCRCFYTHTDELEFVVCCCCHCGANHNLFSFGLFFSGNA